MTEKQKENVIILGGTTPHIELVCKLKERGYYTILIDYLENPPAKKVADCHIQESTLNLERVCEIAKSMKSKFVISACIDQANATACYVAEQLRLSSPYSYQTAINVTNKRYMKQIFKDNQIPTSDFYVIEKLEQLEKNDKLQFPVVVKPVDCNSSKGVRRADTMQELQEYTSKALELSRSHSVVVEEYCVGKEVQVNCLVKKNNVQVLMTMQKKKIVDNKGAVLQSLGSIIPAKTSHTLDDKIQDIAVRIVNAFGLKNTPFFFQAIVHGDDISVLEFAPRIGGGLSSYFMKEIVGVDILETVIDSYLGNEIEVKNVKKKQCITMSTLLYVNAGILDKIIGLDKMKEQGIVKEYFIYKSVGTKMDSDMCSSNRIGSFVTEADTEEELMEKEKLIIQNIQVLDIMGKDILKKELYGVF